MEGMLLGILRLQKVGWLKNKTKLPKAAIHSYNSTFSDSKSGFLHWTIASILIV